MRAVLCGLLSLLAMGAPFTFNETRKLDFTDRDFQHYIIPQLKNVRRYFFSLFNNFDALYPQLIKGEKAISTLLAQQESLSQTCAQTPASCESSLAELHLEMLRLEMLLSNLEGQVKHHHLMKNSPDRYALWVQKFFDLHSQLVDIMGNLQRTLFQHSSNAQQTASFTRELPHLLRSLQLNYEGFFFAPLGEDESKLFGQVYSSFIRPIDKYVLRPRSKDYLKKNAETLNFAWNDFHMKISKSNRTFSSKTLSLANQIHRHWVAVLRVMLRR